MSQRSELEKAATRMRELKVSIQKSEDNLKALEEACNAAWAAFETAKRNVRDATYQLEVQETQLVEEARFMQEVLSSI